LFDDRQHLRSKFILRAAECSPTLSAVKRPGGFALLSGPAGFGKNHFVYVSSRRSCSIRRGFSIISGSTLSWQWFWLEYEKGSYHRDAYIRGVQGLVVFILRLQFSIVDLLVYREYIGI
jgi:hypothetical protein